MPFLIKRCLFALLLLNIHFLSAKDLTNDWTQTFQIKDKIISEQSSYQNITIFNNHSLGKVLMLDDIVQFSEKDEFIYHEMLVHVPMMIHPNPKNVLIIGGGDGACARELLKYPFIEKIIVVELDGKVVDLCKRHFGELAAGAFENPKVHLILDDGLNFIKKTDLSYDLIIVNSSDPLQHAKTLFQKDFYENCKNKLTPHGILVCQAGSPITQIELLKSFYKTLSKIYDSSHYYYTATPSQIGGIKAFSINFVNTPKNFTENKQINHRYNKIDSSLQYYNPAVHKSAFISPKYIESELENLKN